MVANKQKARIIAFYLPQYHPIPENDAWWGRGFTEWTNVGKAKPLFRGHYQPKVPADLGYYDLRLPIVREMQAEMARSCGIEGFCYWHYWFGEGRQLLEMPFNEVLKTGNPDYPFCLGWANHSWADKTFNSKGTVNRILVEQKYPGKEDMVSHFLHVLPAFLDRRYIRVDDRPLFLIFSPQTMPDTELFVKTWQELAHERGFQIHFVAHISGQDDPEKFLSLGYDAVNTNRLFDVFKKELTFFERGWGKFSRVVFKRGLRIDYGRASKSFVDSVDARENFYPTLIPNWDHSPRSGRNGHILVHESPEKFQRHVEKVLDIVKGKDDEHKIVFLKSWNEWGEGNYMEPDLRFGHGFMDALASAIKIEGRQ